MAYAYFQEANQFFAPGVSASAIPSLRCDFDHDGDVDQIDFSHFQVCLTGSNISNLNSACADADLDRTPEQDIDGSDLNLLLGCSKGPDVYADPACLP